MRVMVMVKATRSAEAGMKASAELIGAMGKFNETLIRAGVLLASARLRPSSDGKRVRFDRGMRSLIDGPFAATEELVAGYWIWQVKSMDEALEWVRRCPDPMPGEQSEVEVRPLCEPEELAG